tara:strand:- start:62 stop:205 length:144 start_codon:yes stop_codon:yes gene_type:complete
MQSHQDKKGKILSKKLKENLIKRKIQSRERSTLPSEHKKNKNDKDNF